MKHPAFKQIDHRPWPLPNTPWVGRQIWMDLLFVHWEVDTHWLRRQIPPELDLDLYDNKAWIAVVPFDMKGVTLRGFPAPKWMCDFPEINVRTYVRYRDKPGVWFFSLDVPNPFAVWAARTFYHLPYFKAAMRIEQERNTYDYHHQRGAFCFHATYKNLGSLKIRPDSFEWWASERYCLYTQSRKQTLYRAEIHHPQWPLEKAQLTIHENTLLRDIPIGIQNPSILFSKKIDVVIYPMKALPPFTFGGQSQLLKLITS